MLFWCIFWIPVIGIPSMAVIVVAPFVGLTRAQRLTWRHAVVYFKLTLRHSGVAYSVVGLENLDPAGSYFFACNHESIYDIPLAFACFPYWLIAIAKKAVAYFPIFGWAVWLGGTVFISRGGGEGTNKAIAQLDKGLSDLKKRPRSVLLFPEGTRSESGVVQPFKKGGLVMAIQAGMPVVPVAICNSVAIVGARIESFRPVHHCSVAVIVGTPIETAQLTYDDREALCEQVHKEVVRLKEQHRMGKFDDILNHKVEPFLSCWKPSDSERSCQGAKPQKFSL